MDQAVDFSRIPLAARAPTGRASGPVAVPIVATPPAPGSCAGKRVGASEVGSAWRGASDCRNCGVRRIALFGALGVDDFQEIHQVIDDMQFSSGQNLFAEGQMGQYLYTVKTGFVKLERVLPDGTRRITRVARRGDLIGLEAFIQQPYMHHASAIGTVRVCRIPVEVIRNLEERIPNLRHEFLERWHRAVRETDEWALLLGSGTIPSRMARLLLRLAEPELNDTIVLPKRSDLGAMLGVALETASRVIAQFERDGLVEHVGPRLFRINRAGMQELINPTPRLAA
ncbi:Crp/Fnr family transcriptional regulator [Thiomonas sp.]|jgi:CRP-like cAMP-binding protein|uniref:Crp/Fnr family transcriptional regulator n=1 Tax=Thiomonas sp. TaxID=2047785 RepID=UPI0026163BE8|nr:Crp/Fnr family transcriptional regulator [Thiomonas sp.]